MGLPEVKARRLREPSHRDLAAVGASRSRVEQDHQGRVHEADREHAQKGRCGAESEGWPNQVLKWGMGCSLCPSVQNWLNVLSLFNAMIHLSTPVTWNILYIILVPGSRTTTY